MTGMAQAWSAAAARRINRRAVDGGGRRWSRDPPIGGGRSAALRSARARGRHRVPRRQAPARRARRAARCVRGELRHPRLAEHDLAGRTVLDVASVGKHLLTRFDDGRSLHSHFRMDGSWHLYRPGMAWQRPGARGPGGAGDRRPGGRRVRAARPGAAAHRRRRTGSSGTWARTCSTRPGRRARRRGAAPVHRARGVRAGAGAAGAAGDGRRRQPLQGRGVLPARRSRRGRSCATCPTRPRRSRCPASCCCATPTGPSSRPPASWAAAASTGCSSAAGQRCRRCGTRIRTSPSRATACTRGRLLVPALPARPHPRPGTPDGAARPGCGRAAPGSL